MTILTGCDQNFTRLSEEEKERQIDDFFTFFNIFLCCENRRLKC